MPTYTNTPVVLTKYPTGYPDGEEPMNIQFFSPSYRRPYESTTQKLFPYVALVVGFSEYEEYKKHNGSVIACPDHIQGNLCRVRNWILDNYSECDAVVLMDDDYKGFYRWERRKRISMDAEELFEFVYKGVIMARDLDAKLWGVNPNYSDKGTYREYTPFNTIAYLGGPFQVHMKGTEIRYDENLPLKEDYDISLQHLHKYGKVLRFNQYMAESKQAEQAGGCATYRNFEKEKEQFHLLQKKWGSKIIKEDKKSKRSFDFNPKIHIPIRGV